MGILNAARWRLTRIGSYPRVRVRDIVYRNCVGLPLFSGETLPFFTIVATLRANRAEVGVRAASTREGLSRRARFAVAGGVDTRGVGSGARHDSDAREAYMGE